MTRLLSIDPGVHHFGLAIWEDGKLRRAWFAKSVLTDIQGFRFDEIVCEHPQVYLSNLKAANDMVALGIAAGELVGRLSAREVSIRYILPNTWKGSLPKPDRKKQETPEDYIIGKRVRAALSIFERVKIELPKNHKHQLDVIDAVGIGLFHLKRIGRGGVRRVA